jgi:hypothetical protein
MKSLVASLAFCLPFAFACALQPTVPTTTEQAANESDLARSRAFERAATQLLPASTLREDLLMQQRIEIEWDGRREGFDAAVQKRGETLTLMGLGPFSTRAFTLVLEADGAIRFERHIDRALPFDPEHILADVQRVFYPWFAEPARCDACDRSTAREGLEVHERFERGRLVERRFVLPAYPTRGAVTIRYGEAWDEVGVPREAQVENGWFGYRLDVETTRAQRID